MIECWFSCDKLLFMFAGSRSKVLGGSLDSTDVMVQRPCEVAQKGYAGLYFPELDWRRHEVEPRTGIEFPMILDNVLAGENNSNLCSEVGI